MFYKQNRGSSILSFYISIYKSNNQNPYFDCTIMFFVVVVAVVFFGLFNRHDYKYLIINFYFIKWHFHLCSIRTLTHLHTHDLSDTFNSGWTIDRIPRGDRWFCHCFLWDNFSISMQILFVACLQARMFDFLFFKIQNVCICFGFCYSFIDNWSSIINERAKENECFFWQV